MERTAVQAVAITAISFRAAAPARRRACGCFTRVMPGGSNTASRCSTPWPAHRTRPTGVKAGQADVGHFEVDKRVH